MAGARGFARASINVAAGLRALRNEASCKRAQSEAQHHQSPPLARGPPLPQKFRANHAGSAICCNSVSFRVRDNQTEATRVPFIKICGQVSGELLVKNSYFRVQRCRPMWFCSKAEGSPRDGVVILRKRSKELSPSGRRRTARKSMICQKFRSPSLASRTTSTSLRRPGENDRGRSAGVDRWEVAH